jgi:DNA-binding response OmpR family regulator
LSKVLIVDDNAAVLDVVSELVSSAGFTSITASGGKECLEKVNTEHPDLILLDINMPDLDGWSILRELKEKGLTDKIKVMMLTATTDIGTDIFGLQDVVSGYIRKPFNNNELADRLKAVLEQPSETLLETKEKETGGISRFFRRGKAGGTTPEGMEKAMKSAKRYELRRGFGYVVKEQKPRKSFEIFADQVTHKIQGLCVTRQHPDIMRKEWRLEKTPIIWLSNQLGKVYVNPTNIGILSDTIIRFVEKSGDSIVLIDGVEFLMVNNDFTKVLRMIHHITEAVMEYKSRLLISVDPRALDTREMALLERNMEIIDAMESAPSKPIR